MFFTIIHHTAWIAAGLTLGAITGFFSPYYFSPLFLLLPIVSFVIAWSKKSTSLLQGSILATCVLFGAWYTQRTLNERKNKQMLYARHTLDIIANVADITSTKNCRHTLTLVVKKLRLNAQQEWQPTDDLITLCTPADNIAIDDTIVVETLLCQQYNENEPLRNNLTARSFFAKKILIMSHPHWSLKRFLIVRRNSLWQSLEKKLSPPTFRLISIIFFGKSTTDASQQNIRADFVQWGVAHYLARSGIHLILMFMLINALLSLFLLSIIQRTIITTIISALYCCFSWVSIPFARACMALGGYQLCNFLKIPINTLHILHLTIITGLLFDPLMIACLDFQLTFALTCALILILRYRLNT